MTGTYDLNPMPHKVDVSCPKCGGLASFEFAEIVKIALKRDVPFFQHSKLFDYRFLHNWEGQRWHAAIYYAGLHGRATECLKDLPAGYSPEDWHHPKHLYRAETHNLGCVSCGECHHRAKHELSWPGDAFYKVEHRGKLLWAFHCESATDLRGFVASSDRDVESFTWSSFLLHVPAEFLAKGARDAVVKKLDRLLEKTAPSSRTGA